MDSRVLVTLLESLPGAAYRCRHDADWTLEYISAGAAGVYGYTPRQLVVERVVAMADLVHPDDLESVSLGVERAVSRREPFHLTYRVRRADGTVVWVEEHGRGVFGADGHLEALEGFVADITGRVAAGDALRREDQERSLGHLARGVAHDVNNLLMIVEACRLEIEASRPLAPEAAGALRSIRDAVQDGAGLTRQLLSFARQAPSAPEPVDPVRAVRSRWELLQRVAGAGTTLRLEADAAEDTPLIVHTDAAHLAQAVVNLVTNAGQALAGRGTVTIRVRAGARGALPGVELAVADDGPGMHPEVAAVAFDPFFTTKDPDEGTGLGLAVVAGIMRQAGGTAALESIPGAGTTVTLWWPRFEAAPPPPPETHRAPAGRVVLIAEDEELIRGLFARMLSAEGYTVLQAPDGQEALAIAQRHRGAIHCLVTDARMPRLDGLQLAAAFRETRPECPRLLITGHSLDPPAGLFQAVLRKPFKPQALLDAVCTALTSEPPA